MKRFVLLVGFLLLYTSRGCHQHEYYENEEMISAFDSITDLANKLRNDMWTHAWDFNQSIYSNSSEYFYNYNEGNPDPKSAASMPFARLGKLPLSLSILMNFDQFGTSSVHLSDGYGVFWSDSGNCPHGQIFDPYKYVCRDMFCMEGYVLGPTGCTPDPDQDTHGNSSTTIYPERLLVEMTISHKMCMFVEGYNQTAKCTHPYLADLAMDAETGEWTTRFVKELWRKLSRKLQVDGSRLANIEVISRETTYKVVTSIIDDFHDNNDDRQGQRSLVSGEDESEERNSTSPSFEDDHEDELPPPPPPTLTTTVNTRMTEKIRVKLRIMTKKTTNESETLELYFKLLIFGITKDTVELFGRRTTLTNIIQSKSEEDLGWCDDELDQLETHFDGFRVLASFENRTRYFIYVNSTDTIYSTGYYYMFIARTANTPDLTATNTRFNPLFRFKTSFPILSRYNPIVDEPDQHPWLIDYRQFNLTDVTEYVISNKTTASMKTYTFLATCDRAPKIRILCVNFTTVRVRICEFDYVAKNRSFCWPTHNKCYSVDEYEFDSEEPDRYLRICKFDYLGHVVMTTESRTNQKKSGLAEWYSEKLPAWLCFILTLISTTLLIMCLVTYALFGELRNIPGWNIINLTMALTLAQISFMVSSFVDDIDRLMCFFNSLTTHYGYLASFFWMNVIAFDLFRNFRDKASHVLIHSLTLKDRLPKYAIYGWITPLVIVIVAVVVDLSLMNKSSMYRPCYAGYLPGCQVKAVQTVSSFVSQNVQKAFFGFKNLNLDESSSTSSSTSSSSSSSSITFNQTICDDIRTTPISYMLASCWIQNGLANLIFFGTPIAIIILINAFFYIATIFSICKKRRAHRESKLRRFSRAKLPSQVKFYTQMGIIMGFTWISGFLLTVTHRAEHEILYLVLVYFFLVLNSSLGVFIFFAFICKQEVGQLYARRYRLIFYGSRSATAQSLHNNSRSYKPPMTPTNEPPPQPIESISSRSSSSSQPSDLSSSSPFVSSHHNHYHHRMALAERRPSVGLCLQPADLDAASIVMRRSSASTSKASTATTDLGVADSSVEMSHSSSLSASFSYQNSISDDFNKN